MDAQAGSRIAPVIAVNAFLALQVHYRVVRWATEVYRHQDHFLIKQIVISLTDKEDRSAHVGV